MVTTSVTDAPKGLGASLRLGLACPDGCQCMGVSVDNVPCDEKQGSEITRFDEEPVKGSLGAQPRIHFIRNRGGRVTSGLKKWENHPTDYLDLGN